MICIHCKNDFDESMFYRDKSKPSGRKPRCKKCDLLSVDKKRRAAYEKKYWAERSDDKRKIVRESHEKNKEHHKQVRRSYLKTEAGKAMHRAQTQRRYARKKAAFVENVDPFLLFNSQGGACYICGEAFSFEQMELDHVVPLARGGKHMRSNCKMACKTCNRRKGAKLLEEMIYQMVQA